MDIQSVVKIGVVIIATIAAIIAIIGAFYGALFFIDKRIESRIRDDSFIRELASALRPSVIVDNHGSILVDQGAMRYIEAIDVELNKEQMPYPKRIIVHPKQHLSYAPLLTTLDVDLANISSIRGKKFDWIYTIEYISTNSERKTLRYRLELIL